MVDANKLIDFTAKALKMQAAKGGILLENPEDLGRAGRELPATIWSMPDIRELLGQHGVYWEFFIKKTLAQSI